MATMEVDESQFKQLERIRDTIAKIRLNSDALKHLEQAHKLIDPSAVTPALDADEQKNKINADWQKKFEELEGKLQADKEKRDNDANLAAANAKWETGRRALRDAGYTAEGIEQVEKLMQDRGIADHEVAAAYIEKQHPPQEALTPRAFGAFNFVEPPKENDDFMKALFASKGNDDNAVLKAATEAIAEVRQARRR